MSSRSARRPVHPHTNGHANGYAHTNGHGAALAVPRALLKDQAYDRIKEKLLNDDYPPGTFLSERQLAGVLGMSKTPVKAALERLEAEGFISVSPQQGIVVRQLSVHEIADQYEIRAALESFAVRSLAGKLTAEQVARVRANLLAQSKLTDAADVRTGVELDSAFHAQFIEFLGNREIVRVMDQLRERMLRVITQVFRMSPSRVRTSSDEHAAIAAAVIDGRGDVAAALITEHLERGKRLILSPRG
jgi:DNA-binding GntR family transcriptional regulator